MPGNVDGAAVGHFLGGPKEGTDRTGQRSTTYEFAEALLRHLGGARLTLTLDEKSWARYRAEVSRPFRGDPSVVVMPVAGVGMVEFRRGPAAAGRCDRCGCMDCDPEVQPVMVHEGFRETPADQVTWERLASETARLGGVETIVPVTLATFQRLAADLAIQPSRAEMLSGEFSTSMYGRRICLRVSA